MRLFLYFLCSLLCQTASAQFQDSKPLRKYAIVIGNADYTHLTPLTAPTNDAEVVADLLRDHCDFIVDKYPNINAIDLPKRLAKWRENAKKYDVVLFYFSGHGIVRNGQQYLLLTDVNADSASIAKSPSLRLIKQTLNPNGERKVLLVVDACRSNGVAERQTDIEIVEKSGVNKGSSLPNYTPQGQDEYLNTKTFFASSSNRTSRDGSLYSRYTEVFIQNISSFADKKTVSPFFAGVKDAVVRKYAENGNAVQFPNSEGDLNEEFYLKEPEKPKINETSEPKPGDPLPKKCTELVACTWCKGKGLKESFSICSTCKGTGAGVCIECGSKHIGTNWTCMNCSNKPIPCAACQSKGRLTAFQECTKCAGQGQIEKEVNCE